MSWSSNVGSCWSVQGISAACQNILLAAKAMDIDSLWFGSTLTVEDEIKSLLKVPSEIRLMTTIAIGYPAYEPLPPVRKLLSDIVFLKRGRQNE
jgi:nitroreductase